MNSNDLRSNEQWPAGQGGRPCVGLIQLDTRFARPMGDVGNSNSHRFALRTIRVPGVFASAIVGSSSVEQIVANTPAFIAAARELVMQGAQIISTSCGFLTPLQGLLAQQMAVPVALSALLQVKMLAPIYGAGRVGVICFDVKTLSQDHLRAAQVPPTTPIIGLARDSRLRKTILDDLPELDLKTARDELARQARLLQRRHPDLRAIVLECTNLPPYRPAIAAATGLPIYDINTLLDWVSQGLYS